MPILLIFKVVTGTPNLRPPYGRISDIHAFTVSAVTFDSELSVQKVIPFWKAEILGYNIGPLFDHYYM
jgi:hypothetical protein